MTFPVSNLPGNAVPWGRHVQNEIEDLKRVYSATVDDVLSDNRAVAGQMGVIGRQLDELSARKIVSTEMGDLSLSFPSNQLQVGPATRSFSLPGSDDVGRYAVLNVSMLASYSGDTAGMGVGVGIEVRHAGSRVWIWDKQVYNTAFWAPWTGSSADGTIVVQIPGTSVQSFDVRVWGTRSYTGSSAATISLSNMQATLSYGMKL